MGQDHKMMKVPIVGNSSWINTYVPKGEVVEFVNRLDPDETAHKEPPQCGSTLSIL